MTEQYDEDNYSVDSEMLDDEFSGSQKGLRSKQSRSQERRKWEPHEDAQLLRLIRKWGTKNWRTLANHMKGRLPKQCRERWINHLDPNITKGKLTDEEWKIVLNCHRELGNRWSEIAKFLPGRTPNQIKNHWHAKVRKGTKRTRSDDGVSGDESNSSDSREELEEIVPQKKRKLVVFDTPPDSPKTTPTSPFHRTLIPTGSWEEFETLVEMAELLYRRDIKAIKEPEEESPITAVVVNATEILPPELPSPTLPSLSGNLKPSYLNSIPTSETDCRGVPMKISLPDYEFGLRSVNHPMSLAPSFSYWRT